MEEMDLVKLVHVDGQLLADCGHEVADEAGRAESEGVHVFS